MKFAYTILYVEDVLKAVAFYERAFGFKQKFITPEHDYAELITGETTIAFASIALGNMNLKRGFKKGSDLDRPAGIELAFTTDNIEEDFKKAIVSGASEYEPVVEKPWGQKVGYILDINGFLIEICTPIANT